MSPSHRGSRGKNRRNHNQPARSHVTEHLSPMPGFPIYPGAFGGLTANNIPMDPLVQGSANQPRSVVMHQPRPTTQPLGVGRGNTFPGPGSQHVVYHERPNDSVYQTFNGTGRGQTQMYNDLHPYAGAMQQHQPQPHLTVGNGWMDIPSPSNDRRRRIYATSFST
jgi:hypothetical protein